MVMEEVGGIMMMVAAEVVAGVVAADAIKKFPC